MPKITRADLQFNDYSWTAVTGDDPTKRVDDADRFSRKEGYEVIDLLNSQQGKDGEDLLVATRHVCEWMIHEKLPGNVQGRKKVIAWIVGHFAELKSEYQAWAAKR
jgi:hypothetical protein